MIILAGLGVHRSSINSGKKFDAHSIIIGAMLTS